MKLSVVIPAYNLEKYIIECVDSVVNQKTNFDFEVLVGDDSSTDHTADILQEFKQALAPELSGRLQLLLANNNRGLVGNLRNIFEHCSGEYVAYLDGDDIALPGKLQVQVDYLDANPTCALVYHESEVFDSDSGEVKGLYSQDFYNSSYIPPQATISHLVKYGTFLQASAVMYRNHKRLNEVLDPSINIIVDYPMHMYNAFYGKGTLDKIDQVLGKYRVHSQSFGAQTSRSAERREKVLADLHKACENARDLGVSSTDVLAGKRHFSYAAALYFLKMGEVERFLRHIENSVGESWFFDKKHQFVYEARYYPQKIVERYFL